MHTHATPDLSRLLLSGGPTCCSCGGSSKLCTPSATCTRLDLRICLGACGSMLRLARRTSDGSD